MQDIGVMLDKIMQDKQCSPVYALFILANGEQKDELRELQSESGEKVSRRLRYTSNFQNNPCSTKHSNNRTKPKQVNKPSTILPNPNRIRKPSVKSNNLKISQPWH